HYNFGALLLHAGQRDEAERLLRQACALAPDDASMLTMLATVVIERGDLTEGEKLLRRALVLDPASVRTHRQYGLLLARRGRIDEAHLELLTTVALRPDDDALVELCAALDELGEHEEAVRLFGEACARSPAQAEAYFQWTLRRDPSDLAALVNLAILYANDQRWTDAEPLLQ